MTITKILLPTVLKQKAVHLVNELLHLKILMKAILCSLKHASHDKIYIVLQRKNYSDSNPLKLKGISVF